MRGFLPTPTFLLSLSMAVTYTISDLAKEFDLTTRAMRFYEDMGLLQPERSGPGGAPASTLPGTARDCD